MVKMYIKEGQSIESVLRKFKTKLKKAGILEDHKKSLRFEKRSDRLRRQRMTRKIRARRAQEFMDRL